MVHLMGAGQYISEYILFEFRTSAQPRNYKQFIYNPRHKEILNWTVDAYKSFIRIQTRLKENVEDLIFQINMNIDE